VGSFENRLKPGETLYSGLVRWSLLYGYPSCRDAIAEILKIDNRQLHSSLPTYINELSRHVSMSPNDIVNHHTLLPLFKAFISKEKYILLHNGLASGTITAVHSKLSLIANRVKHPKVLRYCRSCTSADYSQYGHTIWRIEHQLPFIQHCAVHNERLIQLAILRRQMELPPIHGQKRFDPKVISDQDYEFDSLLSSAFKFSSPVFFSDEIRTCYLSRLKQLDLATSADSIRMSLLKSRLKSHWSGISDFALNECISNLLSNNAEHSFPANIFYQPNSFHHPVKHFLIIGFLYGNWEHFIDAYGKGYLGCHYLNPNNRDIKRKHLVAVENMAVRLLKQGASMRKVSKLTKMSMAFVKRVAKNNSLEVDSRPQFLFQREQKAVIKLAKTGVSAQKIAEKICCSVGAVEQIISQTPGVVEARKNIRFANTRRKYRNRLLRAIVIITRRTDIQSKERSAYTWLFKNDRTWLYEQLPEPVSRNQRYLGQAVRKQPNLK
jgi:transposase